VDHHGEAPLSSDTGSGEVQSKTKPPAQPAEREQFQNDPPDPANPNEDVERFREKLRPTPL